MTLEEKIEALIKRLQEIQDRVAEIHRDTKYQNGETQEIVILQKKWLEINKTIFTLKNAFDY